MSVESDLQFAFALINELQGALGGHSLREGTSAATWTAARDSADVTIPHGLGVAPVWIGLTSVTATIEFIRVSADDTNIVVRGYHTDGTAISGTFGFYWEVRG